MSASSEAAQLRPLSIGEIFDRAVTLLVRNAAPFAILAIVAVLPSRLADVLVTATHDPSYKPLAIFGNAFDGIAAMAAAALVAQIYAGKPADWRAALAVGFKRILRAIGANFFLAVICLFPLLFVLAIAVPAQIFRFGNPVTGAAGIVVGAAIAAWLVAFLFCSQYSLCAIGIDNRDPGDCVALSFRLFRGGAALRSFLFALASGLVLLGSAFVAGAVAGVLIALLHQPLLAYGVQALLLIPAMAFVHTLVPVFYYDTRIREEGYDVQAMLAALEPVQ